MNELSYQVGLDIATSLSIIGAAVAFLFQQGRQRKALKSQYVIENLKYILNVLKEGKIELKKLKDSIRLIAVKDPAYAKANGAQLVKTNLFECLLVLESVDEKFSMYVDDIVPIFMGEAAPEKLVSSSVRLKSFIDEYKKKGFAEQAESLQQAEEVLQDAIKSAALTLESARVVV